MRKNVLLHLCIEAMKAPDKWIREGANFSQTVCESCSCQMYVLCTCKTMENRQKSSHNSLDRACRVCHGLRVRLLRMIAFGRCILYSSLQLRTPAVYMRVNYSVLYCSMYSFCCVNLMRDVKHTHFISSLS